MITSHIRGWPMYWDDKEEIWRYCDNDEAVDDTRECVRCGNPPTAEGYDDCLGFLEGAESACCGHGIEDGYIIVEVSDGTH